MREWETLDTTDNDEQTIPDKSKRLKKTCCILSIIVVLVVLLIWSKLNLNLLWLLPNSSHTVYLIIQVAYQLKTNSF